MISVFIDIGGVLVYIILLYYLQICFGYIIISRTLPIYQKYVTERKIIIMQMIGL